ncbi:protein I'm not dead yet [Ceratitis capitata]|uniref:protein I'm not dead yet n=1 Tax=Ceratitis capitata TaxID=7213 RepID=UPI00032999AF|nr:protein I'm not dead yet [Ceratitis capitata]
MEEGKGDTSCPRMYGNLFKYHWRGIIMFLAPVMLLPLMVPNYEKPLRCLYVFLLLSIYWLTGVVPLYATGILPIVLMPFMGILDSDEICKQYFTVPLAMYIGGVMVGLSSKSSNLAGQIALGLLSFIGVSPRRVVLALILTTGFISMWMQNTITTAIMLPIAKAILEEFEVNGLRTREDKKPNQEEEDRGATHLATGYYLAIAYAATIGGCATLLGSATNFATKGMYENLFPNTTDYIHFPKAMAYNIPWVIVALFLLYFSLSITHFGLFRPKGETAAALSGFAKSSKDVAEVVKVKLENIGGMNIHKTQVLILCVVLVMALTFRSPEFMQGWGDALNKYNFILGATPVIAIVLLLFYLPANYNYLKYCGGKGPFPNNPTPPLLSWKYVNNNFPWGIIFIMGSGFGITKAYMDTGLSHWLSGKLSYLEGIPVPVLQLFAIFIGVFFTMFTMNVAAANVAIPIVAEMARNAKTHPINLIYPAGLACSISFLFPISTPPNALVAKEAKIGTNKMFLAGLMPTFVTMALIFVNSVSVHYLLYPDAKEFPDWATLPEK